MAKLNIARLKERLAEMLAAWLEGAPSVNFKGIVRTELVAKEAAAETLENEIDDLEAQIRMKRDELEDLYTQINNDMVDVADGVRGDADYGDDSALYGAMGFVRKSERKSGLTRKTSKTT